MFLKKLKLFVVGLLLIFIGSYAFAMKWLEPGANLPFWPFDGILAIIGGALVSYWAIKVLSEADSESSGSEAADENAQDGPTDIR